ncbi:glycine reductase [Romboutsia weinsteinii]|uniref:Glycine reductase n=1 Tax=Romboutsia weinsteinii TaxID=2020949 RepID=A0A371IZ05_9FIRM|nr:GrdX family protein [Romboutsia weinsteinii]RDY25696.1 glycine reductase [Romboutsia weinsteinii]
MVIITNNPMVKENITKKCIFFKDKTYVEVLKECRKLIHEGYELLSHPLYGSVKPNETPFRSVIMKEGKALDLNSVTLIEEAINTAEKFQGNKNTPNWPEKILDDFRVIDYDIFDNTLKRIQYI